MVAQLEHHHQQDSPAASFSSSPEDHVQKTKSLISALNFVSRNLPLPPELFNTVSSIYSDVDNADFDGRAQERSQLVCFLGMLFRFWVMGFVYFFEFGFLDAISMLCWEFVSQVWKFEVSEGEIRFFLKGILRCKGEFRV